MSLMERPKPMSFLDGMPERGKSPKFECPKWILFAREKKQNSSQRKRKKRGGGKQAITIMLDSVARPAGVFPKAPCGS